jgi:hypothetical protein
MDLNAIEITHIQLQSPIRGRGSSCRRRIQRMISCARPNLPRALQPAPNTCTSTTDNEDTAMTEFNRIRPTVADVCACETTQSRQHMCSAWPRSASNLRNYQNFPNL